jgi:Mn2+/Fe2+ NRAMP family transporter
VIGFFIVIACAATLHVHGRSINDAGDAAAALQPLAGSYASTLFGIGLLGASLLAAAILPLSTAYSVSEALGREARVEASTREEPVFYGTYALVVGVGALVVLVPGAPLVPILFITQAINAVLLLPLLAFIALLTRDRSLMGEYATGRARTVVIVAVTLIIARLRPSCSAWCFSAPRPAFEMWPERRDRAERNLSGRRRRAVILSAEMRPPLLRTR